MTTPSTSSINLAALGFGGMDTASLVTSLVNIENQPVIQLQNEQQNVENASSTISAFSTALGNLTTSTMALSDPTTFQGMQATSSSSALAATATGAPQAGQWSVSVSAIAQAQRTMSNGATDTTSALGVSGTLGITMGNGKTASVAVTAGESLSQIATSLSQSGLPIQASIFYDGSQYHLMVSGTSTGKDNSITFDESGLSSSGSFSLGLSTASNTMQPAQDASLTVDGVPVTSSTNLVTDAIPGVNLALTQPTTSAATITIAPDDSSVEQQIQSFVTAFNNVIATGHADAGYGTTAAQNSILQGDQAINGSLDQLSQIVAEQLPGNSSQYGSLASVGISLNDDGTLSFDTSTFEAAMQADPAAVQQVFVTDSATDTTGIMGLLTSTINSITDSNDGAVPAEIQAFQTRNTQIGSQVTQLQQQVTDYQTQLQNEFTQMNTMLAEYKQQANALNEQFNQSSSSSSSNSVL